MAYRYGDRTQMELFPACVEDYVPMDAPVRAYDAFVEALDMGTLGIEWDPYKVGCPQYDPRVMLKLLVYGYSYGIRSSRKLERETHYNLSFIWLVGGLKPDHKTIAEFRRCNKEALKKVIRECARLCLRLGLMEGNTLFVDGSKWRGNAGIANSWTEPKCERALGRIDRCIEEILLECESVDKQEEGECSLVRLREALSNQEGLKQKVEGILEELRREEKASTNTTDPDCSRIHGRQGSHAGYNGQIVVDEQEGLIVQSDVVNANNDLGQLGNQVEEANETLGKRCETVCADAGYAEYEDLERVESAGIGVVVPSAKQAERGDPKGFEKSAFTYDEERDAYRCPMGHWLPFRSYVRGRKVYYPTGTVCRGCCHFGVCTTAGKNGRQISRFENEAFRERLAREYETAEAQAIYRKRKEKVELPFGHLKRNIHGGSFLLRGVAGVRAEFSLLATGFNMARLITILGVGGLMARLGG